MVKPCLFKVYSSPFKYGPEIPLGDCVRLRDISNTSVLPPPNFPTSELDGWRCIGIKHSDFFTRCNEMPKS